MPSTLCIHHAPCNDGSAAAAALAYRLILQRGQRATSPHDLVREIEVFPLGFGREWDSPIDSDYVEHLAHHDEVVDTIYIVDISLSVNRFAQIIDALKRHGRLGTDAPRVVCIDHHQSAIDRIEEIDGYCDETYIKIGEGLSGATLVWEYFDRSDGEQRVMPDLLRYVADQDIWEWKLEHSREVNAALNTLSGYLPDMADELIDSVDDAAAWVRRRRLQGESMLSVIDAQMTKAFGRTDRRISASGIEYMVVNSTENASQLGNKLCEDSEHAPNCVALIYTLQSDFSVKVSARTIGGGSITARSVAEKFGGGGHDNAAGFRVGSVNELEEAIALLLEK